MKSGGKDEYCVHSRFLETESGDKASKRDLFSGNILIWKAKGKPFEVEILETHSMFLIFLTLIIILKIGKKPEKGSKSENKDELSDEGY